MLHNIPFRVVVHPAPYLYVKVREVSGCSCGRMRKSGAPGGETVLDEYIDVLHTSYIIGGK